MNGVTIFFLGAFLLLMVICVGYILGIIKPVNIAEKKDSIVSNSPADEMSVDKETQVNEQVSVVAPSKFNVDEFWNQFKDEIKKELPRIVSDVLGEVKAEDVEFKTEVQVEADEKYTPTKERGQLDSAATKEAFDTDIRDVDPGEPSAPSATGVSMDELESAVNTLKEDNPSESKMAEAGKTLAEFEGTQLMDTLTSDEEMDRRINLCLRLALRAEISATATVKVQKPKSEKVSTETSAEVEKAKQKRKVKKTLSVDWKNLDIDKFDVTDLLSDKD